MRQVTVRGMADTAKARRRAAQAFSALMDRAVMHIRVGADRLDDPLLAFEIHGTAQELHGPHGVCTCCRRLEVTP